MLRTLVRLSRAAPAGSAAPASYARPTGPLRGSTGLAPRQLLPLRQHPRQSSAPPQPARPPLEAPPGWTASVHAAPAAFPRSIPSAIGTYSRESHPFAAPGSSPPAEETKEETKEERNERLAGETQRCIAARHGAAVWTLDEALRAEHRPLWVAAERWRAPTQRDDGLTLVLTHACGFSKESWRPVVAALLPLLAAPAPAPAAAPQQAFGTGRPLPPHAAAAPHINDVWFLEDTNHGVSVDLNAGALGPALCWDDSARELVNFVDNVLPAVGVGAEAPFQLPLVPLVPLVPGAPGAESGSGGAASAGGGDGRGRRVVGIGHSYGGNALAQAARARPELFAAVLLVEPMTVPTLVNAPERGSPLTLGALKRRAAWPSRAAAAGVRANALFGRWDAAQFALWLAHYLVPIAPIGPGPATGGGSGGVTLATPAWAEAQTFSEPDAPMRGWDALAHLPMPVGFVMAGDEAWMTGEDVARELVWRPPRARNERIMDASHLVIQEHPRETALSIDRFLRTLPSWDEDPQH